MAEPLAMLQSRSTAWLTGLDAQRLLDLSQERYQTLLQQSQKYPVILIAESDPVDFLASFIAACTARCPVFLCNPNWAASEWQQVSQLVKPDLFWGVMPPLVTIPGTGIAPGSGDRVPPGWIMIPTGGSSGTIRFAIHTWETLMASVMGFRDYFQVEQINSCCVLPLYHVSGLMQFLRSLLTEGSLFLSDYKNLFSLDSIDPCNYFLSLVPTQLQKTIDSPILSKFQTLLLGGAPAWNKLLETARQQEIRLAPTYGMTETASQIVTLKPEDFLQGKMGCGQVLPHAQVEILAGGQIAVRSHSLALGYYPDRFTRKTFLTDDIGYFDAGGYLHIVGRSSQKIITGGENVFPAEVEAAIRSSGLVADVYVLGMPDREWGEAIVAVYVPVNGEVSDRMIQASVQMLSRYKQPKRWVAVQALPRNAQGKVRDAAVRELLR
jgi:o-succinylbenzoate---CoA ligase